LRPRALFSLLGLTLALLAGGLLLARIFAVRLPAAERGRRLAERTGCFACHGAEGSRGSANPGRTDLSVPTFEGDLMMFARDPTEIREWIRDGMTSRRSKSETWRAERERGALKMPAFGDRLSAGEIEDLVALVMAVNGMPAPEDSLARHGFERGRALGCFGCHGPGGRFARPNPGSFKGYVPSWDGEDFPELVQSREEFDQWIESGVCERLGKNPLARRFLRRAVLTMPAYRDHLEPGDTDALWGYVQWLRNQSP